MAGAVWLAALGASGAPPPELQIRRDGNQVRLSWAASHSWAELQASLGGATPWDWVPLEVQAQAAGDRLEVTLPLAGTPRFYRLVNPLNHVLIVGQSLGMGAFASDLIHTNQPFQNKMFVGQELDGSLPGLQPDDLNGFIPLVEQWHSGQQGGETIASGFANWISARVGPGAHDLLVSNCARGGADYEQLKRVPSGQPFQSPTGTAPYLRALDQIVSGLLLSGYDRYRFTALFAVHGEGDNVNPDYSADIRTWRADYEADIRQITGRARQIVPMFHSQISAWGNLGNATRNLSSFKMLEEHERDPAKCVLVCPKYFLPYRANDGLHLTSLGYAWLGEYYAKAYYQHILLRQPWSPLRPLPNGITREANIIEIRFLGSVGDLVLDTHLVTNPQGILYDRGGSPAFGPAWVKVGPYGFEYWDTHGSGSPWTCSTYVVAAEVVAPNTVRLTLNQPPLGQNRRIRYGYTALPASQGGAGGPLLGPRGCLRDSDPATSRLGVPLFNWCVHFDKPCP